MRHGASGAVLAIAAILGIVLMVLATALYVAVRSNISSYRYREGRTRAQFAAESGVTLALLTLAGSDSMPTGPEPFSLPGDSAQWIELPSGDRVWVVVDPSDLNCLPNTVGGVQIRSRGMSEGYVRDVVVNSGADFPSSYSLLVSASIPGTFLSDGRILRGPVHSNGRVEFSSMTSDSSGDPWIESVSTTSGGGFYFTDTGRGDSPHPPGSRVWVRPYPRLLQGRPYWDAGADSVDFRRVGDWFLGLSAEAQREGTLVRGAHRVLLAGDKLIYAESMMSPADTLSLQGSDLVFLDSGFGPVYVKSIRPVTRALTIVSRGPIYVMGSIWAGSASAGTPLGLVSLGDVVVARDPGSTGMPDWPSPWDIETASPVTVEAFVACPCGSFDAEDPVCGGESHPLNIIGGLMELGFGVVGTPTSGYSMAIAWDEGYAGCHPPHFPALADWRMCSWEIDPDYHGARIDENQF